MKKYKTGLITIVILCILFGTANAFPDIENVEFVKNYDGDTITVNIPDYPDIVGKGISVRILGIDAPEVKGKCSNEREKAQYFKVLVHKELSEAKSIKIVNVGRDKYFRILGDVIYDGKSLRDKLLSDRDIHSYDGDTKTNFWCEPVK